MTNRNRLPRGRRFFPLAALLLATVAGCALKPTGYQPIKEGFGYEETQLQKNIYKVTFRANRATRESAVIDYLYLRSAQLTRAAGFSHFLVQQDFGKTQSGGRPRGRVSIGLGFFSGGRAGGWGIGGGVPLTGGDYGPVVRYHLGVFVIRMLTPAEARAEKDALEVGFLLESIDKKIAARAKQKS
ncbi:MAG: hypothetical protein V3S29_12650 [bacterium]